MDSLLSTLTPTIRAMAFFSDLGLTVEIYKP